MVFVALVFGYAKHQIDSSKRGGLKNKEEWNIFLGLVPLVPAGIKRMAATAVELRRRISPAKGPELGRGVRGKFLDNLENL